MKYNAKQLKSGQWAVHTGSKYFVNLVFDTQEEAHKKAIYESIYWHQMQMDKMHTELELLGEIDPIHMHMRWK